MWGKTEGFFNAKTEMCIWDFLDSVLLPLKINPNTHTQNKTVAHQTWGKQNGETANIQRQWAEREEI